MEQLIQPFDFHRLFIGDQPPLFLLEIVFRVLVMYFWSLIMVRSIGKRGRHEMSPLEYVFIIALGSATGDPMFYPEIPLIYGMITISSIVVLTNIMSWIKKRSPYLDKLSESTPTILVEEGQIIDNNLFKERITQQELFASLREEGITDVGEVKLAILEVTGKISVFRQMPQKVIQVKDLLKDCMTN